MKELKKEIWRLRRQRFAARFVAIFEVLIAIVGTPLELMFKLNPMILTFKALDNERIDFEIDALDLLDDARYDFEEARDASYEIRELKQEYREKKKQVIPASIEEKEENNEVLEYAKKIITKCNNLNNKEKKAFLKKIKRLLLEYASKLLRLLKNNQDPTSLNELTIKKLTIIEQAIETLTNSKIQTEEVKIEGTQDIQTKKISK